MTEGVSCYLFTLDPKTLLITWESDRTREQMIAMHGHEGAGHSLEDMVPSAREIGLYDHLSRLLQTGETQHMSASRLRVGGGGGTNISSLYLLPTGQVLVASEWVESPAPIPQTSANTL